MTNMHPLVARFAALVEAGEIETGKEIPEKFTFSELEYLYNNGFIYDDGRTFIAIVTDGFD